MKSIAFFILLPVIFLYGALPVVSNVQVNQADIILTPGPVTVWTGKAMFDLSDADSDTLYVSALLSFANGVTAPDSMWGDIKTSPGAGKQIYFLFSCSTSFGNACSLRVTAGDSACDAFCEPMVPFPKRIITCNDFETRYTQFWGLFGLPRMGESVPGTFNQTTNYTEDIGGIMKVGFNAVPGPRCDNVNKVIIQYRHTRSRTVSWCYLQMYHMEEADNYSQVVMLTRNAWSYIIADWAKATPNDGSGAGFRPGDRMDELYCYFPTSQWNNSTDTLYLDNMILYAQHEDSIDAIRNMTERLPRRVAYVGSFETGTQAEHWPGTYTLTETGAPGGYWAYAHAVDSAGAGKYVKVYLQGYPDDGRFTGEQTRVRFRYYVNGSKTALTVRLHGSIGGILNEVWHLDANNLVTGRWEWATADFTLNGIGESGDPRSRPVGYGDIIRHISFLMPGASGLDDFYIDEVTLYEPK